MLRFCQFNIKEFTLDTTDVNSSMSIGSGIGPEFVKETERSWDFSLKYLYKVLFFANDFPKHCNGFVCL